MKKADVRYLKLLADNLPELRNPNKQVMETRIAVTGASLLNKGIKEVKGKEVKAKSMFVRVETPVPAKINHLAKLKTLFAKGGLPLIEDYCVRVTEQANKAKMPAAPDKPSKLSL